MANPILVSVVMPVSNTAHFLHKSMGSILNQTYQNFELICVNDGSTDNRISVLEEFEAMDNLMKIINKQNEVYPRLETLELKKRKVHTFFIDYDDAMTKNALQSIVDTFVKYNSLRYK